MLVLPAAALACALGAGALSSPTVAPLTSAAAAEIDPSAPPVITTEHAAKAPLRILLGTTHYHTGAHNNHGFDTSGPREVFNAAKQNGFDFVLLTEHAGKNGPLDIPTFYRDARAAATAATQSGRFVALTGYEYSENHGDDDQDKGHLTAYGTATMINAAARGNSFTTLFDAAVREAPTAASGVVLGFNHPPRGGHLAATRALLTPQRRALTALSEVQTGLVHRPAKDSRHYQAYLTHLANGWRVAPTCGLDTHSLYGLLQKETEEKQPCRLGVLTSELTPTSLINGMLARRTFTTRDLNLTGSYLAANRWMGSELASRNEVGLKITVRDRDVRDPADRIRRIQVIGESGKVLAAKEFASHEVTWSPTVAVKNQDFVLVRVFTYERDRFTMVMAPVWFG